MAVVHMRAAGHTMHTGLRNKGGGFLLLGMSTERQHATPD
jgi:hypothetical protein